MQQWEKYDYYMLAEMLYAFTVGVKIEEEHDKPLADIIRSGLKTNELDIPGSILMAKG